MPKSWTVEGFDEYLHFPDPADRENKHRGWRKFLGVWARDTDGRRWLLSCVHIISGGSKVKGKDENGDDMVIEDHGLPGKSAEQREDFKAHCLCGVSSVCMRLYSSAESRRGGGIIIARDGHRLGLGSSNVVGHVDKKGEPVRGFWGVTSKETPSGWALSNKEVDRDWVFSDLPIEAGVTRAPRLAWDKGHLSVTAVVGKRAVPAESQDILTRVRHSTARAAAAIHNGLCNMGEAWFRQRVEEVRAEEEDSVREDSVREGRELSGGRASSEQPMSKRA